MSSTRAFRVAATGARLSAGILIAAASVAGVGVAISAPWPEITRTPAQADVAPVPGDTVVVCGGDFRAVGRDVNMPEQMQSAGTPRLTVLGSAGELRREQLDSVGLEQSGELLRLTGPVEDRRAPLIGAAESIALAGDDLAGFAAAPCREPRLESWLVGGNGATGSEDVITLTNAGDVPATVVLTVYGASKGSSTAVVPARSQVALTLSSVARGEQSPVVRVASTGSPVRAMLQSALTRTLDPSGVDLQDAVAGPQLHTVIAGVQAYPASGDVAEMTVLRLLSPDADTQATVRVKAVGGGAATEFAVPLTGARPAEVSLGSLASGEYSVEIDADAPIVSAVHQQDGVGRGFDFAWVTPAPQLSAETLVAVPQGPRPQLNLVGADVESSVVIEPVDGGQPQTITVPAGGAVSVPLRERTVYVLRPSAPVHAAVTMSGGGALAAWPIWPTAGVERSITVYP